MPWEIGTPYPSSLAPKTLAGLPDPAGMRTGASFAVTDYGGNIATVVAGAWRFEYPFRTTWAGRPAVGLVPAGTELQVTDYANQKFISDGTYWRPAQGRVTIKNLHKDTSSPIATISNVAAGVFAIPGGLKVPAGMIIPGESVLYCSAEWVKVGANGTAVGGAWFGKTGTQSDAVAQLANISIGNNIGCQVATAVKMSSSPNKYTTKTFLGYGSSAFTSVGQVVSQSSASIDMAADMFFTLGINNGNTGDSWNLIAVDVWMEA